MLRNTPTSDPQRYKVTRTDSDWTRFINVVMTGPTSTTARSLRWRKPLPRWPNKQTRGTLQPHTGRHCDVVEVPHRSRKCQLECELKLAGVLCAGDAAEVRGEGGAVGDVEVGVIEKVVGFGAELELDGFGHADVFLEREVERAQAGSDDGIARGGCRKYRARAARRLTC